MEGLMLRSDLAVYLVAGVFLILLVLLPHWLRRRRQPTPATTKPTRTKREPKPCAGLTRKPERELCGRETVPHSPGLVRRHPG
jgi:hypothetical protein